jgi:hypothetical protein
MKRCIPEVLSYAHTNFKNDEKLNEIVKISEQPNRSLTLISYGKTDSVMTRFLSYQRSRFQRFTISQ